MTTDTTKAALADRLEQSANDGTEWLVTITPKADLKQAAALLRANAAVVPEPELNLYYMRDNHTFRRLPHDVDAAIAILRAEFADGCTHGMLCSKHPGVRKKVHATGEANWSEFEQAARAWIAAAVEAAPSAPVLAEPQQPTPEGDRPRLDWSIEVLRGIADKGRQVLGDDYPLIVQVIGALKREAEPDLPEQPVQGGGDATRKWSPEEKQRLANLMTGYYPPSKVEPGSEMHFNLLMVPYSLTMVVGQDRQHLLGFARDVWSAALALPSAQPAPQAQGVTRVNADKHALSNLRRVLHGWYERAVALGADGVSHVLHAAEVAKKRGSLRTVDGFISDWKFPSTEPVAQPEALPPSRSFKEFRERNAEALAQSAEFNKAIDFAILQGIEAATFLDAWRHGDTTEWPEYK